MKTGTTQERGLDAMEDQPKKPKASFQIIGQTTVHGGYGAGMLDLSNLSSIIVDGDRAYIDLGALHAKSRVERGIKFTPNREEVPDGRRVWVVWVKIGKTDGGPCYAGATACEMKIDEAARKGWKILADHVNRMDYALKGRFMLNELNETEKAALRRCLVEHNAEWYERSPDELKHQLET